MFVFGGVLPMRNSSSPSDRRPSALTVAKRGTLLAKRIPWFDDSYDLVVH